MATKTNVKCKALSVSEKLEGIQKVDAEPHVTCAMVVEQFNILSVLNNVMVNKKNIVINV
jgi:hypothetical protein